MDVGRDVFVDFSTLEAKRFCHEKIYHLKLQLETLRDRETYLRVHIDTVVMNLEELRRTFTTMTWT